MGRKKKADEIVEIATPLPSEDYMRGNDRERDVLVALDRSGSMLLVRDEANRALLDLMERALREGRAFHVISEGYKGGALYFDELMDKAFSEAVGLEANIVFITDDADTFVQKAIAKEFRDRCEQNGVEAFVLRLAQTLPELSTVESLDEIFA